MSIWLETLRRKKLKRRNQRMSRNMAVNTKGEMFDPADPDNDMVNNPGHYQSMVADLNIDCITAMRAAFGNYETAVFCKLNAFKYVWRASSKNGNEDIDKASWYLSKYRELGGENQ
jgi:hypothetical protein